LVPPRSRRLPLAGINITLPSIRYIYLYTCMYKKGDGGRLGQEEIQTEFGSIIHLGTSELAITTMP
jgi:hypothetical protein